MLWTGVLDLIPILVYWIIQNQLFRFINGLTFKVRIIIFKVNVHGEGGRIRIRVVILAV